MEPSGLEPRESAAPAGCALDAAVRVLRHRDRSAAHVEALLAERGYDEEEVRAVLDTLQRTGVVDDARHAENRARTLADRGCGDAYIRHELARTGLDEAFVEDALATLDAESARAARVVTRRGATARTARYLAAKGFSEEVVRRAVAEAVGEGIG